MKEENDFFKRCFNIVAGFEVKNESQAIAKEVVLDEIENLQSQLKAKEEVIKEAYVYNQMVNDSDYVYSQDEITYKNLEILSKGENNG